MDGLAQAALQKGAEGKRVSKDEALALFGLVNPTNLFCLQQAALSNRTQRFGNRATFVSNVQVNPSNICEGSCRFCRYAAKEGDAHAYVLTEDEILGRIDAHHPTEAHIVGGMNRLWHFERSRALVSRIRDARPEIHIKAFTAVEIDYFARETGLTTEQILGQLQDAGVDALPGGGAEVFSKRMRKKHCPSKLSSQGWLDIHRKAHRLGMSTNATLLYGLDETDEERADHLLALRELQNETGGFSCFIPLPFQPGGKGEPKADVDAGTSPMLDLGLTAIASLVLDNFPHIKAYWPMMGLETAAAALSFGADDLDGTIGEERIAHAAGAPTPKAVSRELMIDTIFQGGFVPIERDGKFDPVGIDHHARGAQ